MTTVESVANLLEVIKQDRALVVEKLKAATT